MTGSGRRLVRALAVAAALLLPGLAATSATAAAPAPSGTNAVAVPYLGELQVRPAEGYSFLDCGTMTAASGGLTVACDATGWTLRATTYDPDAETLRVPVALGNATTQLTVDYLVSLEPPDAPVFADIDYGYPFPSGSRVLIPLSDLRPECTLCVETGGVGLEALAVEPADAARATVTPTHVVLETDAAHSGPVEVQLQATDDLGQRSQTALLTVHLYGSEEPPLLAAHATAAFAPEPGAPTTVDLTALFDGGATLLGCGAAIAGTVTCSPSGQAQYQPSGGTTPPVDQFSFHVAREDGEQATGSVTLLRGGPGLDELLALRLAPADGDERAAALVPALPPPPEQTDDGGGVFTPFARLLDRIGA
ncbi:hypothetical protein [Desertivibrio insolitus]|uniref:hypothetical protein n=1 Tax=Herbiconiux sp. SYSU D00978 TaxID=2812562 RepID=UPI001A95CF6C|nr:hypothetical protein [Herbiconiux sp. SYSU D00978]